MVVCTPKNHDAQAIVLVVAHHGNMVYNTFAEEEI
jgi:hypothetical protein